MAMQLQRLLLLPVAAWLLSASLAHAQAVGTVTTLSGMLVARGADGTSRVLAVNSQVREGDTLATQRDTYARVVFKDAAEVLLQPGTTLAVRRYVYDPDHPQQDNVELSLLRGGLRSTAGKLARRNAQATVITTPDGALKGSADMVVSLQPPRP
jgi:hypothetical protein